MKWTVHRLSVREADAGQRLDRYIAGAGVELSRTQVKKIIDLGGVHVNGRRLRNCSSVVAAADKIEVYLDHQSLEPFRLAEQDIVFRDDYLIVINKPALLDVQPTHARYKGTLYEALQIYLQNPFRRHAKPDIGMVQRLDRGTSGLLAFSIHPRAHKEMTRIFLEHDIDKRYLAVVHNAPSTDRGEIRSLLARSRKENRVHSVSKGGKEAITRFRVVKTFTAASVLELELITGRSHQIRAHMAEQGCPLVGDLRYGGKVEFADHICRRPLLHARSLAFKHPLSGKLLEFSSPVPRDMHSLITSLEGTQ